MKTAFLSIALLAGACAHGVVLDGLAAKVNDAVITVDDVGTAIGDMRRSGASIVKSDDFKVVYSNTVEFLIELATIFNGILTNGVDTDEQISGKLVSLTIVESDNVGKIVMLKITHVDIKDVIVGTKNYVNIADSSDLTAGDELQPAVRGQFILENKLDIFTIVPDHGSKFLQIYNY